MPITKTILAQLIIPGDQIIVRKSDNTILSQRTVKDKREMPGQQVHFTFKDGSDMRTGATRRLEVEMR